MVLSWFILVRILSWLILVLFGFFIAYSRDVEFSYRLF